jgi:hypothetical protein
LVYSVKVAELFFRCIVEIEAISKELFINNGGIIKKDAKGMFRAQKVGRRK